MTTAPLSERLRPKTYDDFVGQETIWNPRSPLYQLAKSDSFHSLVFWGPPGTGKTTLAGIIGKSSGHDVVAASATNTGVKDLREMIQQSELQRNHGGKSILIFLDEIHRLARNQQDVLLPAVESGAVKLIGATTENPSFEVNHALLSRSLVFQFKALSQDNVRRLIERANASTEKVLPELIMEAIAAASEGDGRRALNLTEAMHSVDFNNFTQDDLHLFEPLLGGAIAHYDKDRDQHYDTISAFIKSIRASDPDAGIYYLARMLEGGEDPLFIARRLTILASEDIGNANPTALILASSAFEAVHRIGMPESRIILAQLVTYLAASPKSNRAYIAIDKAIQEVQKTGNLTIPLHIRNAPTAFMKNLGYGKNYAYAHDDPTKARQLTYLPESIKHRRFYEPSENGSERQIKENLNRFAPERPKH